MADSSRGIAPLAIIIMGVSGSGKSTLAREISAAMGLDFLEGDAFHMPESIAKMAAGSPLTDDDRWPWLDRLGHAVNANVETHGVALATCSALKRIYRDRLRQTIAAPVNFVLLEGERDVLARRLSSRTGHYMPASLLSSQLETLELPGPDEHVLTLDAALPPAELRDDVLKWLAEC
ncbi:gluconokinase, GntK/IdnK-type [Rhizomicrobium electricum]|uniref:gluconokinase, GntK/IdnK-type n=1 Tax=Rhizomicrobium electricum TaxID=480070 RepID=UPI001ABB6643|nr:gluconokinase [Rhizomicrobium electricum]